MISAVIAIPVESRNLTPEFLDDGGWDPVALTQIAQSGVPGGPAVDLFRDEFPSALRPTLDRYSRRFWAKPLPVAGSVNLVALEYFPDESGSAVNVLLVHLQSPSNQTNRKIITDFTRLRNKNTASLLKSLFSEEELTPVQSRGIGVVTATAEHESDSETWESWDTISTLQTTSADADSLCNGRFSHILIIVAIQHFTLNYLESIWPKSVRQDKEFYNFREKFHEYRHEYEWAEICTHELSQQLYHNLRSRLAIPAKTSEFASELRDYFIAAEAESARKLNRFGFLVALTATIPVWLTANWTSKSAATGALCLLGVSAMLGIAAFIQKHRQK